MSVIGSTVSVAYRRAPLPVDSNASGPRLVLTRSVVEYIDRLLPKNAHGEHHENVLYIVGMIQSMLRVGVTVIAPKAETSWGSYNTSKSSHAEVLDVLGELGLVTVAQVHCHPGTTVFHSDADDDLAFIRAEGHWSIVVPYYGVRGMLPLTQCGFHVFSGGRFSVLSSEAASQRVSVLPDSVNLCEEMQ